MVFAEAYTLGNSICIPKLGLDYIDMMLIHSPQPWVEFREED